MMLTTEIAAEMIKQALIVARARGCQPLAVAVLDARGALKAFIAEDGTSTARPAISMAKANSAIAMGVGSRALAAAAKDAPQFFAGLANAVPGGLLPHAGGVLIKSGDGTLLGAVGISGDKGNVDEVIAIEIIEKAGLKADAG